MFTDTGINALDPVHAEDTLFDSTVTVGILLRLVNLAESKAKAIVYAVFEAPCELHSPKPQNPSV